MILWCSKRTAVPLHSQLTAGPCGFPHWVVLSDGRQGFRLGDLCRVRSKLWYFQSESEFHGKPQRQTHGPQLPGHTHRHKDTHRQTQSTGLMPPTKISDLQYPTYFSAKICNLTEQHPVLWLQIFFVIVGFRHSQHWVKVRERLWADFTHNNFIKIEAIKKKLSLTLFFV